MKRSQAKAVIIERVLADRGLRLFVGASFLLSSLLLLLLLPEGS